MKKILILEPGAWGTALGIILSKKNGVSFWYKNSELAFELSHLRKNERLPETKIPKKIFISSDLKKVIKNSDLIIIASPAFNFRATLNQLRGLEKLPPILGIAKGIEKETLKLPSQIVEEILKNISYAHLSGPGFAREIVKGKPSPQVIASSNKTLLKELKKLFLIPPLRILISPDLIGVQLAGAMKNTLAIGISLVGAHFQDGEFERIRPKLINQGLEEMIKIGRAMGAEKKTFLGPAGKGDLILTSSDSLSRNFQFGKNLYLDADKMRKEIRERKITVEGFENTSALYQLGKIYKLNLPMIEEIYKVIYEKVSPEKTIENLINLTKIN